MAHQSLFYHTRAPRVKQKLNKQSGGMVLPAEERSHVGSVGGDHCDHRDHRRNDTDRSETSTRSPPKSKNSPPQGFPRQQAGSTRATACKLYHDTISINFYAVTRHLPISCEASTLQDSFPKSRNSTGSSVYPSQSSTKPLWAHTTSRLSS